METLLILAAVAVAGLALAFAAVISAQSRRPPLRMRREEDIAQGDEDGLIRSLRPTRASPIDRNAQTVEAEWSEPGLIDVKTIEAEMIEARLVEDRKAAERPVPPRGHGTR